MRVLIYGAGLIGLSLGAHLARIGVKLTLLVRPAMAQQLANGLRLTSVLEQDFVVAPDAFAVLTEPPRGEFDLLLLTTKATAIPKVLEELAPLMRTESPPLLVCLQNGIGTDAQAAALFGKDAVRAGIVPFNVVQRSAPQAADVLHLHRASGGSILLADHPMLRKLASKFRQSDLPCQTQAEFINVQWGKLLLNLNNAINALSGLPLLQQLADPNYRAVLAAAQRETLVACKAAGIQPAKLTAVPAAWLPHVLRLPTPLFRRVAKANFAIDAHARSSMAEDFAARRSTEIAVLNGAVVALAHQFGRPAPVNQAIVEWVRTVESRYAEAELPHVDGATLRGRLGC
jgi:2-dehydropantoate 2-reductase